MSESRQIKNHGIEAAWGHVRFIPKKIKRLDLDVSKTAARRVNVLTSTIDFKYFFGGYYGVFNLCLKLKQYGHLPRLILTDATDYRPDEWNEQIQKYQGLERFFEEVEVVCNEDRGLIKASPGDQFIASSWWTAFIAHEAIKELGGDRFIYMSQDYEPAFHPHDALWALARQSYDLPHYALFSTEFLQDFSREHQIGVYAEGVQEGDKNSTYFQNAIGARSPLREEMENRKRKRLLMYARPEPHAGRNCFPLAVLGLVEAMKNGHFAPSEWELHGIGAVNIWGVMEFFESYELTLLPKVDLEDYYELLPQYDLGLSLMLTPHPSLVPLDMAASGLVTVTNSFDIKTPAKVNAISSNLITVSPTIDDIRDGLIQAASRCGDLDARWQGTKLKWARNWDESYDSRVMEKLSGWIGCSGQDC